MSNLIKKIADPMNWYFLVLIIALSAGLILSKHLAFLADSSTFILGVIFFLGALKVGRADIDRVWHSKGTIFVFDLLMLIGLPIIVYLVAMVVVPEYALPLLILAAMPTGMAAPLMADIVGGRESLAMAMTVTTSLLAPFTVPAMIRLLAGVSVEVGFWSMFLSIAEIIFIPFILAWFVKSIAPGVVAKTKWSLGKISTVFLGLLVAGIIAKQSSSIVSSFVSFGLFKSLWIVTILVAFFYILGYFIYVGKVGRDRLTLTVSFANMNFTLAIYLAQKYFPKPEIIIPITLAVVPWFVFIVLFKYITKKFAQSSVKYN